LTDSEFIWRDGERTIYFRAGAIGDSPETLAEHEFGAYELLTTERAMGAAPIELAQAAAGFHHVAPGPVNEVAARVVEEVSASSLVALGGGRVIDVAKAVAAVRGGRVAALPTTLSGAEMTRIHRLPEGHPAEDGLVRPELVLADPPVITSLPERRLRASAINALAHGADSLYTPFANPVSTMSALRGAGLIAKSLDAAAGERDPAPLALGSVLCAYALDSARFAIHHVICQSLVRTLRIPHAETNAAILPRVIEAMVPRAGKQMTALARALGTRRDRLGARIEELGGGRVRLSSLDADEALLDDTIALVLARPELELTPDPPDEQEIRSLIEAAW
jgi:alcohol dehydrogenase class IV